MKLSLSARSNILRAFVMGTNDGIISIAALAIGVASATNSNHQILVSSLAGIIAGMISMSLGEIASVSSERDAELTTVNLATKQYKENPDKIKGYLVSKYKNKGLNPQQASQAVTELLMGNPIQTYVQEKYGFDSQDTINPLYAGIASFVSFPIGSLLPLLFILLTPTSAKVPITFLAVIASLAVVGYLSAKISGYKPQKVILRNMIFGSISMMITYIVGVMI